MHIFCFQLSPKSCEDAPLVVLFDGCPSLARLVDGIFETENTIPKDQLTAFLAKFGLTDNTLAQTMVLLTRALADGHWPSIENRLEDGSLMTFQLLLVQRSKLISKLDVMTKFRRRAKVKEN